MGRNWNEEQKRRKGWGHGKKWRRYEQGLKGVQMSDGGEMMGLGGIMGWGGIVGARNMNFGDLAMENMGIVQTGIWVGNIHLLPDKQ